MAESKILSTNSGGEDWSGCRSDEVLQYGCSSYLAEDDPVTAAITIHFRKPELTASCIGSLLADGWGPVLVWDNSADGGATLRILQKRFANDSRVLWAGGAENLGFAKGMNAALVALARHGYDGPVLLINNDARVKLGMRVALHISLAKVEGPALIAPHILQDGEERGWLYYQRWFALVTMRRLIGSFGYLSGCCLLVQRDDNAQPLFDEDFFMYGEDVELSWRWRRQGGHLLLLDHAWLAHDGSASSGQLSKAYEDFLISSHWLLASKLAETPLQAWLMRILRLPLLLARACLRSLRHRSLVPMQAFIQILAREARSPRRQASRR